MRTYKIEPVSRDNYSLEVSNGDFTALTWIRLRDIPRIVHVLGANGFRAEKIEWHCCEK